MNNQKNCPNCGTQFEGRSNQTYCSSRCKTQAHRANKSQDETLPVIRPIPAIRPVQISSPKLDKTALEVERIRLLNAERLKEMEYQELDRKRVFEANQQKRKFEEEREREEWRADNEATVSKAIVSDFDQSIILKRLDELSNQLVSPESPKQADPDEDNTSGSWETPAIAVGGALFGAWLMSLQKHQPPPKPPIHPNSSSLSALRKLLATKAETTQ